MALNTIGWHSFSTTAAIISMEHTQIHIKLRKTNDGYTLHNKLFEQDNP